MAEAVQLYTDLGWPALEAGGFSEKLVGYFITDTGPLHQLIHIWRFDDDTDRRDFWILSGHPRTSPDRTGPIQPLGLLRIGKSESSFFDSSRYRPSLFQTPNL